MMTLEARFTPRQHSSTRSALGQTSQTRSNLLPGQNNNLFIKKEGALEKKTDGPLRGWLVPRRPKKYQGWSDVFFQVFLSCFRTPLAEKRPKTRIKGNREKEKIGLGFFCRFACEGGGREKKKRRKRLAHVSHSVPHSVSHSVSRSSLWRAHGSSTKKTEAHGGAIQRISGWARRAPAATLGAARNMPF
jgi:hypothetical protein